MEVALPLYSFVKIAADMQHSMGEGVLVLQMHTNIVGECAVKI